METAIVWHRDAVAEGVKPRTETAAVIRHKQSTVRVRMGISANETPCSISRRYLFGMEKADQHGETIVGERKFPAYI